MLLIVSSLCFSNEQISEALGHLIGQHLESLDLSLDRDALVQGLSETDKESPLDETACLAALEALQKKQKEERAQKNLLEAETFLAKNKTEPGIASLEGGNLQYQTTHEGTGPKVEPYNSPIVRLKGRYLNGISFNDSGEEELLSLDEAIPALRLGLIGMQEGERRTLYIHPSLGFGLEDQLSPNGLLICEVEIVQADASAQEERESEPAIR